MSLTWREAVKSALMRYIAKNGTAKVERTRFLAQEVERIVAETGSRGATPSQTVSRVLQELRDEGFLFFSNAGVYTLNTIAIDATREDLPDDVLENAVETGQLMFADVAASDELATLRVRRGAKALRRKTLLNYRNRCALCDITDDGLLVASHIERWADNASARGLLANTICFCTLHDKLFEVGYFSVQDDLALIWNSYPASRAIDVWRQSCTSKFKAPGAHPPAPVFLNAHRNRVGL